MYLNNEYHIINNSKFGEKEKKRMEQVDIKYLHLY